MEGKDASEEGPEGGVGLVDLRDRTDPPPGGNNQGEHNPGEHSQGGALGEAQQGAARAGPWPDASRAVQDMVHAARDLVAEGVLPVGLEAGDRPAHDAAALLHAMARVESVLAMRMAIAESSGSLPFLSSGGMASQVYWSRGRARALSRAGNLANQRPDIAAAWTEGAITAEHVDAAARGVAGLTGDRAAAVLDGLGPIWGQVTPATVATYCARARAIVDPPPDDPDGRARKAHDARFLSFSMLDDTIHISGALARLDGELLMNAIHANAERMRVAGDGPTAAQRRADALMQLAALAQTGGAGGGGSSGRAGNCGVDGKGDGKGGGKGDGTLNPGGVAGPDGTGVVSGSLDGPGAAGASTPGRGGIHPGGVVAGAPISITLTADLDAVTESGYHLTPGETQFALCDPTVTAVLVEPAELAGCGSASMPRVLAPSGGQPRRTASPPLSSPTCPAPLSSPPTCPPPANPPPANPPPANPPPDSIVALELGPPGRADTEFSLPESPESPESPERPVPRGERLARLTADSLAAPQPLAVGRAQRVATAAQRRALAIRDGGCVLPGCDIPAGQCQVHHLVPWTEGGATDLPNLVTLCWAHHRQVDLGRWDIHPLDVGRPGTPANNGAPFTISVRPRRRWNR